jgi:hypothetical protein
MVLPSSLEWKLPEGLSARTITPTADVEVKVNLDADEISPAWWGQQVRRSADLA